MVFIIVLKLDPVVNSGQGSGHWLEESTWVDMGQCEDKNCY